MGFDFIANVFSIPDIFYKAGYILNYSTNYKLSCLNVAKVSCHIYCDSRNYVLLYLYIFKKPLVFLRMGVEAGAGPLGYMYILNVMKL